MRKNLLAKVLFLTVAIAAAALLASHFRGETSVSSLPYEDHRAPIQNPVIEPDRPDLSVEPGNVEP